MGIRALVAGEPFVDLLAGQPEVGQCVPVHRPAARAAARVGRAARRLAHQCPHRVRGRAVSVRPSQAYTRSIVPSGSATNAS